MDPRFPLLVQHNVMTNGIHGVLVTTPGTPPAPVTITQNSIFDNSALGIDLLGNGVTPNDVGDGDAGPNGLQNFPIIKSVEHSGLAAGASTRILGNFHGAASTTFNLEFFANPACSSFRRSSSRVRPTSPPSK